MENLKIQDDKQLSQEELLKRVELMEKDLDKCHNDVNQIIKTLENKFMWELNLNGMEMLRDLKSIQKQEISND